MPLEVREDWLAKVPEEIVDPNRRIIDPHHHFFVAGGDFPFYDLDSLWGDTETHNVEQTVFLQCWEGYRTDGPEEMMPVGETEWVESIARTASRRPAMAQIGAIMGTAELRLGAKVRAVLEAHVAASPLFRGIRLGGAWDADENIMSMPGIDDGNLYEDAAFREGFSVLADMGLCFDAYQYHTQTKGLTALAKAFPSVNIVNDHLGTPLGVGPYAGKSEEVFAQWAADLAELASCPNVSIKLGGLAMPWNGFGFDDDPQPPTSDEVVEKQARYYDHAIEVFGADRCMFESNFPVDKCALSYTVLWNAFKKMAAKYTEPEQDAMFRATAARFYQIEPLT
ncbi:MAG: L-fuconolactonase [Gammaproteobacteria bacterium]|jgi:L-fuconolactonase